jgi:hypothetical protein
MHFMRQHSYGLLMHFMGCIVFLTLSEHYMVYYMSKHIHKKKKKLYELAFEDDIL